MDLVLIVLLIIIGFVIIGFTVGWLKDVYRRFLKKQINATMELMELEEEYKKFEKENITLMELKTYYDLHKKITGKELEVLEMTRKNFERYKTLINFRGFIHIYKTDEDWVYKNAKVKVLDNKKEKK